MIASLLLQQSYYGKLDLIKQSTFCYFIVIFPLVSQLKVFAMLRSYHIVLLAALSVAIVLYYFNDHGMLAGAVGIPAEPGNDFFEKLLENTKSTVIELNAVVARRAPLAFSRAFYVDLPILLCFFPIGPSLLKRFAVAVVFYEVRQDFKAMWVYYGNPEAASGFAAGIAGGVVKYGMLGLDETVGSFATGFYEMCGSWEECYMDPATMVRVIMVIEPLDAFLQASMGRTPGVSPLQGLINGIKIGVFVIATTYTFLLPALETAGVQM